MYTSEQIQQIEDFDKQCVHALFEDGGLFEQSTPLFETISTNAELLAFACIKRSRDIFIAISHMEKYSNEQAANGEVPILPNPVVDISFRSCLETVAFGWWILNNPDRALAIIKEDWKFRQDHAELYNVDFDELEFEYADPISLFLGSDPYLINLDDLKDIKGIPTGFVMISKMGDDLETQASVQIYKALCAYSTHATFASLRPYMGPGPGYKYPKIEETATDFFRINLQGFTYELLKLLIAHLDLKHQELS